ncbi:MULTISPECIES: beta strand repeat-containing protein [unclassified Deinococcus]|uniref:beta strand repeat-containing protein n=1 Tax=unclassified Deinococcus TaxID=2623546 RepID=UPI001C303664|nr:MULTISPECIES: DUF11 domain-containing protein [unclassified Deinococcus]MDK2012648.1 DUF11 domain-containing protein [Deinococcus sp. 43]
MYYFDRNTATPTLYRVDLTAATPIATLVGAFTNDGTGNLIGAAFTATGQLYTYWDDRKIAAANTSTRTFGSFVSISGDTFSTTVVNGDLIFDATGQLWAISNRSDGSSALYTVAIGAGDSSFTFTRRASISGIAPVNGIVAINGLAIDSVKNSFYVSSGGTLYGLDALSSTAQGGTVAAVSKGVIPGVTDLASCGEVPNLPTASKSFSPSPLQTPATTSTLNINIGNSNRAPYYLYADITDTMPTGMTVNTGSLGGTCVGRTATTSSITLPKGSTIPVGGCTITATVNVANTPGSYVNTIAANTIVGSTGTVASTTTATLVSQQAPTINKSFSPASIVQDSTSTLTFTITNANPNTNPALTNLNFTDALTGMSVASTALGGTCAAVTNSPALTIGATALNLTIPSLAAGASCTVTVSVVGTQVGVNPNTTSGVSSAQTPTRGAVSNTANLTVTPAADLAITKTGPSSVVQGDMATYTLKIWNQGPSSVTGAVISDTVPNTLTNVTWNCVASGSAACGTASGTGNAISFTSGALPVNTSTGAAGATNAAPTTGSYLTVTVTGTTSSTTGFTNTATVAVLGGTTDGYSANNSASQSTAVNPPFVSTNPPVCSALTGNTGLGSNLVTDFSGGTFGVSSSDPTVASTGTKSPAVWPYLSTNIPNYTYIQVSPNSPNDGFVSLVNRLSTPRIFNVWSSSLTPITVNSSGVASDDSATGRFLLINGANPGLPVLVSTISGLSANTNYQVSGLFANLIDNAATGFTLPNIDVYINGVAYFRTGDIPQDQAARWRRAGFVFNTGSATSVTFQLVNNVPAANGNDFAFDQLNVNQCQGTWVNTISGYLYGDLNVGGTFQNPAEPQLPAGVKVDLRYTDANGNAVTVAKTSTGVGADSGRYVFTNVPPPPAGFTYYVHVEDGSLAGEPTTVPTGYTLTTPNNVTLPGTLNYTSGTNAGPDFGFRSTADLSITKTDGVTSVNAGGTTTYTIRVTNLGSNPTTAILTDAAVSGLNVTAVSCSATPGRCTAGTTPTISQLQAGYGLPILASGETYELTVTATVTATSGSVANTATVTAPAGTVDGTNTNNSATDTDTVTPVADLSVTKTDGVSSVNASGTTTYTIRVTNAGPSSVTGATLTDAAVAGLTVTSVTCSNTPGQCSAAPTVTQLQAGYALPALASGQFFEIRVTGTVTATGGTLANTATVTAPSGTTDPTAGNNSATDTDTVTPVTDVAVSKAVNVVAAGPGGTVTYTIRAWNNGPSPAGSTTLTDTVSASLTGVTWTCAGTGGASCSAASGSGNAISLTVNLGTDTGSVTTADTRYVTLTVTGTLVSSATGTLGNTASVSDASDSTPANNSASVSTRIVDAVNDTGSVTFNQGATFTILANDTVGGAAATTTNATLPTIVTNGGLTGLSVNASGQLVLAASALNLPGTYTVTYQICDATLTSACDTATIAITVTPAAADLAITKAQRAGTGGTFQTTALSVVQGGAVQYQIVVTNNGPSAVTNATFTDAVPANLTGLSVVSATGTGTTCTASFTGGTLNGTFSGASGTSCTVTIQGTATTTGTFTNTATVTAPSGITDATTGNNTASVNTTVTPAADLAIDKSAPVAVGSGRAVSYTIRVWNNGPSSVTGATVTDSLPSGFTVTGISCAATGTATCGTQTFTASSVTITTGTLSLDTNAANATPDGNFLTYTLTGTAPASGTLSNTASVAAPAGTTDLPSGNNSSAAAVTRVIDAVNDAAVNLAFGTGGTVTVLGNDTVGGAAATTANVAVTVQNAGGITGLTVNGSGQLFVPAATPAGSYTVTYQICDATLTTACDAATVTVDVGAASADVIITKTGPAFAKPGETISYTLTVTNAGPNAATAVTVSDTLPTGLTYVSSAPAATVSGQTLSWTLGTLAASASQTITVTATAPSEATLLSTPATRTVTNTASVSSATTDPTPANNTATAVTQMVAAKLTKSVRNVTQNTTFGTSGGGLPGEVLEYCIAFENIGGAPLPNFVVTDHVPGTTNAQAGGYDAEEASAATGFGVKLTRGTTTPTTSYFTSAADADTGALSSSGGTFGRGTMTVNLGALAVGDQGSVCFRTAIR